MTKQARGVFPPAGVQVYQTMALSVARRAVVYVVVFVVVIVVVVDYKTRLNITNSTYRLTSFNTKEDMDFVL